MNEKAVINSGDEELIIIDLTGDSVFITPMSPEEVEQMLREDPSLRSLTET